MALNISCIQPLTISPAKTSLPSKLILHNPCVILHPPPWSMSVSFSKTFVNPLRASPTQKYTYPDPIPEFAEAETEKFRAELSKKLFEDKETFGDDLDTVIDVCAKNCPLLNFHVSSTRKRVRIRKPFAEVIVKV